MGKEWLYRGGGGGGGKSTRGERLVGRGGERNTHSGCMSAIFQLFDLHQFQFQQPSFMPDSLIPEEPNIVLKGVEAPRNSLDIEGPFMEVASASCSSSSPVMKEEENLNIPMGIQIKTSTPGTDDECSSCSPGTKTPNLVARLMGLDLLPDQISSPRPSSSSNYSTPKLSLHHHSRSLPETPRISTASRRSDVDYHHRLSLQINKENYTCTTQEFDLSSSPHLNVKIGRRREIMSKVQEDESSPSHYARRIVKQVRESVSRRVGADITNTIRKKEQRRDENLVLLKPKKPSSTRSSDDDSSTLSCSPRLRFLENKNKPSSVSPSNNKNSHTHTHTSTSIEVIVSPKPKSQPPLMVLKEKQTPPQRPHPEERVRKCEKIASERYDLRVKKLHQNKQEEPFVNLTEKKCKRSLSPLSNNILDINSTPKFLSFKKDPSSPSSIRSSQKQVSSESITQLPSCQSRLYNPKAKPNLTVRENNTIQDNNHSNVNATTTTAASELEYISRILKYSGIDKNTPISATHFHSPSHPLDPAIFHRLEVLSHSFDSQLSQRSSRKLMFELVDEIILDILKPYMYLEPWLIVNNNVYGGKLLSGEQLFDELRERIGSFPSADCKVLEDIDALIDTDLSRSTQQQRRIAFEEEAEKLVIEIEREIVEKLVRETAVLTYTGVREGNSV